MKKFKGVFDGLRNMQSTVSNKPEDNIEFKEVLEKEDFAFTKVVRYGFPHEPTCMAFDPIQKLLAIGNKSGSIRILGRPGVDCHLKHESDAAVSSILFLINEGALISVCKDDCIHLWNFRQKKPEIVHTLQFQKERLTHAHLPFQNKWLYIGTDRGNVHIVSIEDFSLSGYVINWNKAIEISQKTHPGPVIHLSTHPSDESKLLIGYDRGVVVLWDLKTRTAEFRFPNDQSLKAVSWHFEGKQFLCAHADGSLVTWNLKAPQTPANVQVPHARKNPKCKQISHMEWKQCKTGIDDFIIFSGGLPVDERGQSVSVLRGKSTTVLEMEHRVLTFLCLCNSPYPTEAQDPYAIAVLLQNDLVVVDLLSPGFPCFENPYPMDVHESPVTCCSYLADCPSDLIPAYYSAGSKQKRQGFSVKNWPIMGGERLGSTCSYSEIIITGHQDGSIKFWDGSGLQLQVLYKIKSGKHFERSEDSPPEEEVTPVQRVFLCSESRSLAVAGSAAQFMLYKFSRRELNDEITTIEVVIEKLTEAIGTNEEDAEGSAKKSELLRQDSVSSRSSATSEGSGATKKKQPGRVVRTQRVIISVLYALAREASTDFPSCSKPNSVEKTISADVEPSLTAVMSSPGFQNDDKFFQVTTPNGTNRGDGERLIVEEALDALDVFGAENEQNLSPPTKQKAKSTNMLDTALKQVLKSHKLRPEKKFKSDSSLATTVLRSEVGATNGNSVNLNGDMPIPPPRRKRLSVPKQKDEVVLSISAPAALKQRQEPLKKRMSASNVYRKFSHKRTVARAPSERYHQRKESRAKQFAGWMSHRFEKHLNATNFCANGLYGLSGWRSHYHPPSMLYRIMETSSNHSCIPNSPTSSRFVVLPASKYKHFRGPPERAKSSENMLGGTGSGGRSRSNSVDSEELSQIADVPKSLEFIDSTLGGRWSGFLVQHSGGSFLSLGFLDQNFDFLMPPTEVWKDNSKSREKQRNRPISCKSKPLTPGQDANNEILEDSKYLVSVTERCVYVYDISSQQCICRTRVEGSLVKASVITVQSSPVVLACTGSACLIVYSLPSLRVLLNTKFLPTPDLRVARTLCFSHHGHAMYMCSPSEIQKVTVSSELSHELGDMIGDIFMPCETPEPPKASFLKNLFSSTTQSVDKDELFGPSSGMGSKSVAKHIAGSGLNSTQGSANSVAAEVAKTKMALLERGEKLNEAADKTERMMDSSKNHANLAKEMMLKYKNKKWYQF